MAGFRGFPGGGLSAEIEAEDELPAVSVVVANYNGGRFLPGLLRSLARQSLTAMEILIVDDASTDESVEIVRDAAAEDSRIVLQVLSKNSGPGAARNRAIAMAKGKWIAIVDCDDLIHPFRFERLLEKAERWGAHIIADNLFVFHDDGAPSSLFLQGKRAKMPTEVSLADYIRENRPLSSQPSLGYLKPIIRRSEVERLGLRYNERLRIGEDYDFVLRALSHGLRFWVDPFPFYCYRKHTASVSHRLGNQEIEAMEAADRQFMSACDQRDPRVIRDLRYRFAALRRAKSFNCLVAAIKARRASDGLRIIYGNPRILPLLAMPVKKLASRLYRHVKLKPDASVSAKKAIYLISRQRLLSARSGSSAYVLSLAEALRRRGLDVHLICPSPSVFGRVPVIVCKQDAKVFSSIRVRGALRIGPVLFALNPAIALRFLEAIARLLLLKAGLKVKDRRAPYSVAMPWCVEDLLFASRHTPSLCKALLFDYGFQTVAAPYLAGKTAKTFVIMHDLISSRHAQFQRAGHADSLPFISEKEEIHLLTGADVVVAIQQVEADIVRARAPKQAVICSPMAVPSVSRPEPGDGRIVFFVGTSTAPNVTALTWFLGEVWPLIVRERPEAEFWIAGSVGRALRKLPARVKVLGVVPNLAPLYAKASVVVSPLLTGSGLKIKLIEGLALGKAMVVTSTTLQGVGHIVSGAVEMADAADEFAARTVALLADREFRIAKATLALEIAQKHFSAEACYREFLALAVN